MKKTTRIAKAFSLIELSIVLLIIGVIIAGITQSSRLIRQFKLNSARTLTQSSPVASISGLVLWLEPTMEASFLDAEEEDETGQISTWNDINPQLTTKNNYTKSASSVITYEDNSINGLPAIESTGAAETLVGSLILTPNNYFTLFVVSKQSTSATNAAYRVIFNNGNGGNGFSYMKDITTGARDLISQGVAAKIASTAFNLNSEISSITYGAASGGGVITNLYLNGATTSMTNSTVGLSTPTSASNICNGWMGTISEVIVFDRALKASERNDVEAYLSKKYGIAVVVN